MWSRKKHLKSIRSYLKKIEEHFLKIQDAIDIRDYNWYIYYLKEMKSNFFDNIEKERKKVRLDDDMKETLLSTKQRFDDLKSIPWD